MLKNYYSSINVTKTDLSEFSKKENYALTCFLQSNYNVNSRAIFLIGIDSVGTTLIISKFKKDSNNTFLPAMLKDLENLNKKYIESLKKEFKEYTFKSYVGEL